MTAEPNLAQLPLIPESLLPPQAPCYTAKLHRLWRQPQGQPAGLSESPTIQRYLALLGPLAWHQFPERNLQRDWGQPTIP
jgi:hypothetical protein